MPYAPDSVLSASWRQPDSRVHSQSRQECGLLAGYGVHGRILEAYLGACDAADALDLCHRPDG
jgi:hypothetical protein